MEQPKNPTQNPMAGDAENSGREKPGRRGQASEEVRGFVEKHRDYFEQYARGAVKFEPAPEGLNTFAFNLENNTIYVSGRFYEARGLSDEKTAFAVSHEVEHFLEKKALLAEPSGARKFAEYLGDIKKSKAYALMDNCVADVRQNRAVIGKATRETAALEEDLYQKDLFPEKDLTQEPKHIQFCNALLREARVPDEVCSVAPEVRQKLDTLYQMKVGNERFFDLLTHPETPMSLRLDLQNEYILPMVDELKEQDMKDEEEKKKGKGDGGEGKEGAPKAGEEKAEPNDTFKEAYERAEKRTMPEAVPQEELERAFKEWKASRKDSPLEKADTEYAKKLGVAKADLENYRRIAAEMEKVKDPETGCSVIEELRELIRRIIAQRLKKAHAPRYPVEEGEELVDPAGLIAEAKAGNLESKVWETFEVKEKRGGRFGEIQMTLIFDRSSSMNDGDGAKRREQQKTAVLAMEALKEFADIADEERANMEYPVEVLSEVYTFQASAADGVPRKKLGKELGEKERIEIAAALSTTPGGSTDFVPLEAVVGALEKDEALRRRIEVGEVKKLVIVFTDGESDDAALVQSVLKKLREAGAVAVGIGITDSGKAALATYAPDARLAKKAEDLSRVFGELFKEHLAQI